MKVLLINSEYPPVGGGAGNASFHLARSLARLGVEVTVLTARYAAEPESQVQDGVRVLRSAGRRRHADRSGAMEQAVFMVEGLLAGLRLVRGWRPDVTLAFFAVPCGAIALGLERVCKVPYVVSLRGGDVPGFRPYDFATYHRLLGPLIRLVWRRARAVVANSRGLRDLAAAFDSTVEVVVIGNGVDVDHFAPVQRVWQPPHLLFVGRVVYQKGIDLLLEALADLRECPWKLTIVGDGNQRETLTRYAAEMGIGERVHFEGWLQGQGLLRAYHKANLFVLPSRHEGMPNVVLEAMAAGLPVIASRVAGSEELVIPEESGLLVPANDVLALRQALARLLDDAEARARMGRAGRERARREFSWERVARDYQRLLLTAIGSK